MGRDIFVRQKNEIHQKGIYPIHLIIAVLEMLLHDIAANVVNKCLQLFDDSALKSLKYFPCFSEGVGGRIYSRAHQKRYK